MGASSTPATGPTTRVSGKVTANDPGGVTVSIAPTSLVDEAAQGANYSNAGPGQQATKAAARSTPIGKVYGTLVSDTTASGTTASSEPAVTTTTTPDGSWAFTGVKAPGYYLVTFSKPGYATAKYIATTTVDGKAVLLSASIAPGNGAISGSVSGPHGPLGGVALTITDGTVTLSTKTPTVGATGTWGVTGLTTPDTYLVTATLAGYGTQVAVVNLPAAGTRTGVALTMTPGVGSLSGLVTSSRNGAGVGNLTVTASDGTSKQTATTTTTNPVGSYFLPNLDIPGTYALTVSGPGWVTQTQQVQLTGNAVVNAQVTPSTADVTGVITDGNSVGLPDAGVALSNDTNTFKTLTQSASPVGGYDFGQVPPGQYVLTATDYGYATQSAQVTVASGDLKTVNLSLPFVGQANTNTAVVQGNVVDLFNAKPIQGATLSIDGVIVAGVTSNINGDYVISGVGPGVHAITATASGYESATVRVSVPIGGVAFAPPLLLPILDRVGGLVLSNADGSFIPNPTVTLNDPNTNAVLYTQTLTEPPVLPGVPLFTLGGFEIDNVHHGNYSLVISATHYVTKSIPVTLTLATNLLFNGSQAISLDRDPSFQVVPYLVTGSAPPVPVAGVVVTVRDATDPSQPTVTAVSPAPAGAGAPAAITQLFLTSTVFQPPHTYVASFTYSANGQTYAASDITFVGAVNNTAVAAAVLSLKFPTIAVSLQYPYLTPTGALSCLVSTVASGSCPAAAGLPTVVMTGVTGYTFPAPGVPGTPQTSSITATPSATGGPWVFPASASTSFLPSTVTFSVTDGTGTFAAFSAQADPTQIGFNNQSFTLVPTPTPLVQTISPPTGVAIAITPSSSQQASGSVAIAASEVNGALVWNDPATGRNGYAQPGTYRITYSHVGFDPVTINATVGLCSGCGPQALPAVTLVPHVTLSVVLPSLPVPPPASPGRSSPSPRRDPQPARCRSTARRR